MRILQIEGDESHGDATALGLQVRGFQVETTSEGHDGVGLARTDDYDVILIGEGLADMEGKSCVHMLRAAGVKAGIVFLPSGLKLEALVLDSGADDVIARPFHFDVLVARIQAVARRAGGLTSNVVDLGCGVECDLTRGQLTVRGVRVPLPGKEYAMFELMARRKGKVVSKAAFMNHLYGGIDEPEIKIVDVFICKIRAKLARMGVHDLVRTEWGRGYLIEPLTERVAA